MNNSIQIAGVAYLPLDDLAGDDTLLGVKETVGSFEDQEHRSLITSLPAWFIQEVHLHI
jgi:hypothetical protein